MNYSGLIEELNPIACSAGRAILEVRKKGISSSTKADGSPVTEADAAAENLILDGLKKVAPNIPVVSEENIQSHALRQLEQFFLVDPLDGTKEFLKADNKGAYTVNIALIENASPVCGVVYAPALDRLFFGDVNSGAFERSQGDTKAIRIRSVPASGPVAVASASHRDAETNQWLEERGITQTVSIGSSLKFCLVACGEADVYPRFGPTMEWDTAAGDAILRAAGGRIECPDGVPFDYGKPNYKNGAFIAYGAFSA